MDVQIVEVPTALAFADLAEQAFACKCWGCGVELAAREGVMVQVASGWEAFCWRCAERVVECQEKDRAA